MLIVNDNFLSLLKTLSYKMNILIFTSTKYSNCVAIGIFLGQLEHRSTGKKTDNHDILGFKKIIIQPQKIIIIL